MTGATGSTVAHDFLAAYADRDWPQAIGAIDRHWTTLLFAPETSPQVFATLGDAPEEDLRRSPKTALMAETLGRLPRGSVPVPVPGTQARIDLALRAGTARDLVEVATLGMVARRATGLPDEAARIAAASRPLLRAATVTRFSPAAEVAAYWHLQAAQAELQNGDSEHALLDFQHAWTLRDVDATGYVATSTAPFLALLAVLSGDDDAAARWQAEVDSLAPAGRSLIDWETMERPRLVARLLDATDRLDPVDGEQLTELLLSQLAFDELWPVTLFAIVRHLVNTQATARAQQLIDTTVELHGSAPRTGSLHHAFAVLAEADVALALGRGNALRRLLNDADHALLPGLSSLYAVHAEIVAGDLPAAQRLAKLAEHRTSYERVRRESKLLRAVLDADGSDELPSPLPPTLRRLASLLPPELNARLRDVLGPDVPTTNPGLVGPRFPVVKLTTAEERVLGALRDPGSLPEIADRLSISRNTLKTHLRALYAKLGAASRDDAVAIAGRLGLVGHDEGPPP